MFIALNAVATGRTAWTGTTRRLHRDIKRLPGMRRIEAMDKTIVGIHNTASPRVRDTGNARTRDVMGEKAIASRTRAPAKGLLSNFSRTIPMVRRAARILMVWDERAWLLCHHRHFHLRPP